MIIEQLQFDDSIEFVRMRYLEHHDEFGLLKQEFQIEPKEVREATKQQKASWIDHEGNRKPSLLIIAFDAGTR